MKDQSGKSTLRVFFALWPSETERNQLVAWQKPLHRLCGGRIMRNETLHCTLVFIGEIEHTRLEALQLAAQEMSASTFELCFDHANYWGHNHIVYAMPGEVPEQLAQLVETLERRLGLHGFDFEHRSYQPHVTLLRNARWTHATMSELSAVCWQARDFVLVQSTLQQGVANYEVLARFPLSLGGG